MKIGYRWKKKKKVLKVTKKQKEQQKVFSKCRFTPTHVSINLGQTKMEEKKEKMN
jgi:hypothetical protein